MECRRHEKLSSHEPVEFLPEYGSELRILVRYDGFWDSVESHDLYEEDPRNLLGGNACSRRYQMYLRR